MLSTRNTKLLMHEVLSYFPASERTHFRSICSDYEDISLVSSNLSSFLSTIIHHGNLPLASFILLNAYRASFPINSDFPSMADYASKPIKFKNAVFNDLKLIVIYKVTGKIIDGATYSQWEPQNQSILDWYSNIDPSTLNITIKQAGEANNDVHMAISLRIFDSLDFLEVKA